MKENRLSLNLLYLMLAVYAIASIQFIYKESKELLNLRGLSYSQKLDRLDMPYYRNTYYRYYEWLNDLIPRNMSFSILFNERTKNIYARYERKLNYYLYPRHVLFNGVDMYAYHKKGQNELGNIEYPEFVLDLDCKIAKYGSRKGIKYISLKGRTYYLVSTLDEKALLVERSFLVNNVSRKAEFENLRTEFKKTYGIGINKALL